MSLLFLDGMDHISGQQLKFKYDFTSFYAGGLPAEAEGGRFNSACMTLATQVNTPSRLRVSTTTVSKLICGLGFNPQNHSGGSGPLLRFACNDSTQMEIRLTSTNTLLLFCGSAGSVASSTISIFPTSTWNWVELEAYWHSTTGSCTVYLSDVQFMSFTGDTTTSTASGLNHAEWHTPMFKAGGSVITNYFDDFYLMDDQGSANKTRVGSTARIRTYFVSGDGTVSMTPLVAGNNWSQVGEGNGAVGWNTTTYVHASAASTYDQYSCGSITSGWGANETPWGVQVVATALTVSGTATVAVQLVVSGLQLITASQALSTVNTNRHMLVADAKPSGSAWAVSTLSATFIGAGFA